jgi:hypothetical protein
MKISIEQLAVLLMTVCLSLLGWGQADPGSTGPRPHASSPLFQISFQRGEPISGLSSPAIRLPFQCTSDGTVFVGMIHPPDASRQLLASVSPSRESHLFPLDQVPDLYDLEEVDHYASESSVLFLVRAAEEKKLAKGTVATSNGVEEVTRNAAEHHSYIVLFDRAGRHQKTVRIEDALQVRQIGVFPSGMFLAYGWDELNYRPQLALLKNDGTLLEYLSVPLGGVPESALRKKPDGTGAAVFVAPVQFLQHDHAVLVAYDKSRSPVLEVSESGAIRLIRPKLPADIQIDMIVPSDKDLYARVNDRSRGSIYRLDLRNGRVSGRFQVGNDAAGADVACVHEGKFFSFEYGEGGLVPLTGTAESLSSAASSHDSRRGKP